ncbi:MAG: hypothetical protein AAGC55_23565, partial [Myxococcota bacterium]
AIAEADQILGDTTMPATAKTAARLAKSKAEADKKTAEEEIAALQTSAQRRIAIFTERIAELDKKLADARSTAGSSTERVPRPGPSDTGNTSDTATSPQIAELEAELAAMRQRLATQQKAAEIFAGIGDVGSIDSAVEVVKVEDSLAQAQGRESSLRRDLEQGNESLREIELSRQEFLLNEIVELCAYVSTARLGWNLSLAGAMSVYFPGSTFDDGELEAAAGWLTTAYTWPMGLSLVGATRVAWQKVDPRTQPDVEDTVIDVGGRVVFAKGRYATSFELIGRFFTDEFDNWRAGIKGEYMIRKGTWVTVSFGKDFSKENSLFSIANLTWGFGDRATLDQ